MTRNPCERLALALLAALAFGPGVARAAQSDADFVAHAASDGMLEVQLGRHAAQNAQDPSVRDFGERMVRDHGRANEELKTVASDAGMMVPTTLRPEHQDKLEQLTALQGAEFDRRYMDEMVKGHQKDVNAFREQAKGGDSAVDRWAEATLPTLEEHLAHAREIQAQTQGAAEMPEAERTSTR
jgi:putative membrane protein